MRDVIRFIEARAAEQRRNPFIGWLEDESIPARERLTRWLPTAAIFVFGFRDLHDMALVYPREEAEADEVKAAINAHVEEDANHWGWYLHDLRELGLDAEMRFTEVLRLLWSDDTRAQRFATYRLCQLADRAQDPLLRYGLIKAIEAFGQIIFETASQVARQLEADGGVKLQYLGEVHSQRESGGLQRVDAECQARIEASLLDPERRERALAIAAEVCDLIEARWIEFHKRVAG